MIVSAPKQEREVLQWSIEVIDPHEMEDTFVAYELSKKQNDLSNNRNGHNSRNILCASASANICNNLHSTPPTAANLTFTSLLLMIKSL